jgi:hypothetical protein
LRLPKREHPHEFVGVDIDAVDAFGGAGDRQEVGVRFE